MAAEKIGVAVVGTGFGQKVHIPGLQAHHRTEVVAVYHRDGEKAHAIAQAHGIPHACTRIEDLVALPAVEAVSISTPPFLHFDQAQTVLAAGKHLLLEKPTTLNVTEAQTLLNMAAERGLVTAMDFEFRFIPAWQHLAALLRSNYVGQPRLVKVDWLVPGRADASRPWNWYARKDQGGGALGAFASHTFDYLAWLLGPARRLCARLYTAIPQRPDPTSGALKPVDADDTCSLLLELVDGTPCQVAISSVAYGGRGHWLEVYGDRGTLVLGSDNLTDYVHGFRLYGSQDGAPLAEIEIPAALAFPKTYADGRIAPFVRVVDRWVEGIDQKQTIVPSLEQGVYSQQLMDLAHQSNISGAWVDVPL